MAATCSCAWAFIASEALDSWSRGDEESPQAHLAEVLGVLLNALQSEAEDSETMLKKWDPKEASKRYTEQTSFEIFFGANKLFRFA